LSVAGDTWKGYMEDMGNIALRDGGVDCGHPLLGTPDITQVAVPGDGYASRHDPFIYFHSVIDNRASCEAHVVPLGSTSSSAGLATDLKTEATTPNFSFIVPNLCDDGHDPLAVSEGLPALPLPISIPGVNVCTNDPTQPGGLTSANAFLQKWVPLITSSPAFKDNGLLVVTFDEGSTTDGAACCGETPGSILPFGPATASPIPAGLVGPGGGVIGAVLLSPYIKGGTVSTTDYNHYSLLGSIEDLFGVEHLGEAQTVTSTFGADVYSNWP
jgi:hypothetical protein